jgi:hypothetical protein
MRKKLVYPMLLMVVLCAISISVHAQGFGTEDDPGGDLPPVTVTPPPDQCSGCLPPVTVTPPPPPPPPPTIPAPDPCQVNPCSCNPQSCGVPPTDPCQTNPCSCNPLACAPPPANPPATPPPAAIGSITVSPIRTPISSTKLNLTAVAPTGTLFVNGGFTVFFNINPQTNALSPNPNPTAANEWDVSSAVVGVWSGPYTQTGVINFFTAQGVIYFTIIGNINMVNAVPAAEIIDVQYNPATNSCHMSVRP